MIAPRLKSRSTIPYGGMYYWKDPLTGAEVRGTNWNMLIGRIYAERRANGVPVGLGFEDEVEKDLCRDYPAECEIPDPNFPRKRQLTLSDIINGTKVILSYKLAGSPTVSRQEAERRASICVNCTFNVRFAKPCIGVCPELQALVTQIVGAQGTHFDQDLHSCSICSCYNAAQIWVPMEFLAKGVNEVMKSQFATVPNCWKQVDLVEK